MKQKILLSERSTTLVEHEIEFPVYRTQRRGDEVVDWFKFEYVPATRPGLDLPFIRVHHVAFHQRVWALASYDLSLEVASANFLSANNTISCTGAEWNSVLFRVHRQLHTMGYTRELKPLDAE